VCVIVTSGYWIVQDGTEVVVVFFPVMSDNEQNKEMFHSLGPMLEFHLSVTFKHCRGDTCTFGGVWQRHAFFGTSPSASDDLLYNAGQQVATDGRRFYSRVTSLSPVDPKFAYTHTHTHTHTHKHILR
jgi:hypothetical protein